MIAGRFKYKTKKTMGNNNQLLTYVVIGLVAAVAFGFIQLPEMFSSSENVDELYPSDLKTTITLNTGDKLATTATQVTTDYYVFTDGGEFLKKGTTSSGTASFTVPTGGNYKLVAFYDSGTEYLPIETTFSTDGADPQKRAIQSVNLDMYKSSNTTISKVRNPIDLDSNVTCSASSTCHFDVLITATTARAAAGKPVIVIDVNSTEFDDIQMTTASSVDCPKRLTSATGHIKYCFATGKDLLSSDGVVMYSGYFESSSTGPAAGSTFTFTVVDTVMYAESDYQTQGYSALKYGTENPIGLTNIGSQDSASATMLRDA